MSKQNIHSLIWFLEDVAECQEEGARFYIEENTDGEQAIIGDLGNEDVFLGSVSIADRLEEFAKWLQKLPVERA